MPTYSNQSGGTSDHAFVLQSLPIREATRVDGLKLIETARGSKLLYSVQVCRSPRRGLDDCEMKIQAVELSAPSTVAPVVSLPRPLPPPPRWDARATEGGYEFLYEEAGGALYRLLLRKPSGETGSPSAADPFQSFARPRFLRGDSNSLAAASATVDDKALVVFPDASANPPTHYIRISESPDGVVGKAAGWWLVTKATMAGAASFNELPGRLSLLRLSRLDPKAVVSSIAFPGLLAYEFDAAGLGDDVAIFATGKPAVLLLASRATKPIALVAGERRWLSKLSRPTLSVAAGRVHVAAIANPGTDDARILYGDFAIDTLRRQP